MSRVEDKEFLLEDAKIILFGEEEKIMKKNNIVIEGIPATRRDIHK